MAELAARSLTSPANAYLGDPLQHVLELQGKEFGRVAVYEVMATGHRYIELSVPTTLRPEDMTADFGRGFRAAAGRDDQPEAEWVMWAGTNTSGSRDAKLIDPRAWEKVESGINHAGEKRWVSFNCGRNGDQSFSVKLHDNNGLTLFTTAPMTPELMRWVLDHHQNRHNIAGSFDSVQASQAIERISSDDYVGELRSAFGREAGPAGLPDLQ